MPPRVVQHIPDRIPYLPHRAQHVQVVAVAQHRSPASESAVHRLREARGQRLHPAPERRGPVGLDDRVEVVVLERELEEPECAARGARAEALDHGPHDAGVPQRGQPRQGLQGDVAGEASGELRSRCVADPRARAGLASCARAPAAVGAAVEGKLGLLRMTHRGVDYGDGSRMSTEMCRAIEKRSARDARAAASPPRLHPTRSSSAGSRLCASAARRRRATRRTAAVFHHRSRPFDRARRCRIEARSLGSSDLVA